jgi:prophage maintenance system killer protein
MLFFISSAASTLQHPPHNRLHQLLAVRLRAQKSGFKLIAEGHELVNPGNDADKYYNRGSLNTGWLKKLSPINLLTLGILLDVNEQIKIRASKDHRIEYSGSEDYPIKMHELKKLIEYAPKNRDILGVAAYYLKNIILLQAFPDANHRTALTAIEMFLEDNGLNLDYTTVEAYDFRKELYNCRLMVYKTYE